MGIGKAGVGKRWFGARLSTQAFPLISPMWHRRSQDTSSIISLAKESAEQDGIVVIDEIDKLASSGARESAGGVRAIKGEGVQKELLALVEGSSTQVRHSLCCTRVAETIFAVPQTDSQRWFLLNTADSSRSYRYAPWSVLVLTFSIANSCSTKADFTSLAVLFIGAGAFTLSKPADLLPELQGRLPIRVALQPLSESDFVKILSDTEFSLVDQIVAMMKTEGVELEITDDAM